MDTNIIASIRKRRDMYLPKGVCTTVAIVSALLQDFLHYELEEVRVTHRGDFVVIRTNTDWIQRELGDVDTVFTRILSHPRFPANSMRSEVLIAAFAHKFYTFGLNGELGKRELLQDAGIDSVETNNIGNGRLLVIQKELKDDVG